MFQLNDNLFVKEAQTVIENYAVMLNLLHDSKFTVRFHKNMLKSIHNHECCITLDEDANFSTYVMKVFIYEDETFKVVLDKNRIKKGINSHYKLRSMRVSTSFGLVDTYKSYWNIYGDSIDDLNKIIQVIDKQM